MCWKNMFFEDEKTRIFQHNKLSGLNTGRKLAWKNDFTLFQHKPEPKFNVFQEDIPTALQYLLYHDSATTTYRLLSKQKIILSGGCSLVISLSQTDADCREVALFWAFSIECHATVYLDFWKTRNIAITPSSWPCMICSRLSYWLALVRYTK